MKPTNNRKLELLIYAGGWLLAIVSLLLDIIRERSYTELPLIDAAALGLLIYKLLPFMILFAFNNYILIPHLLKHNRYKAYFISTFLLIIAIATWQIFQFVDIPSHIVMHKHPHPGFMHHKFPFHDLPHRGPSPLLPLPLFQGIVYDLLIVGGNLAISLMFQHFKDRLQHEQLMKENAQNQLTYLKAQINPHFYMNMLNNIHGMIEIDPDKAQDMVLEMSELMRYMLYKSSNQVIELSAEVKFIRNYIGLMRERYPEDIVNISVKLTDENETIGATVPPLLFLIFIENAFKHGISYSGGSYISISLSLNNDEIVFLCINSVFNSDNVLKHEGIGLENAKKRMNIIYGENYSLEIESGDNFYSVNLTLPYEIKNSNN